MADVAYNTKFFPALIHTLSLLVALNVQRGQTLPLILMGYKERDEDERTLWILAKKIGIDFERIDVEAGRAGDVEIWLGRISRTR